MSRADAIVVGSGPNGLAAAITLAEAGLTVTVIEAGTEAGGGMRTAELTLSGFHHDVCSSVFPLAAVSPFFTSRQSQLDIPWLIGEVPCAHPLRDGVAVRMLRSVRETAGLLDTDSSRYHGMFGGPVGDYMAVFEQALGPLRSPVSFRAALHLARFGWRSASGLSGHFQGTAAQALLAGAAAHSGLPMSAWFSGGVGFLLLLAGHAAGWPVARGGARSIVTAMTAYLGRLGGRIVTGKTVTRLDDVLDARLVLLDLAPRSVAQLGDGMWSERYAHRLRGFRHGCGVFKVDWALSEPIPWTDSGVGDAVTVHVGGTAVEIAQSESIVARGGIPDNPFVIVTQPSVIDDSRAPHGRHIAWGYCHVPNGAAEDCTARIESQIERFAPGFRDCILARSTTSPAQLEAYNANYIGGDIACGEMSGLQIWRRPAGLLNPYATPHPRMFLCSAATPPGPGVHGMCGFHAARSALRSLTS